MAFSQQDKKEIETIVRKEIKDFLQATTVKKFEDQLIDKIKNDMKSGKLRGDINDFIRKAFVEFYYFLWAKKSTWENTIKNLK
jgi:predicted Zn-dependent peptidase